MLDFAFVHFISFYPFCAVFCLYEHILASTQPEECDGDVRSLESIGMAMQRTCEAYPDLIPISRIINALNKVSRTTHDHQRQDAAHSTGAIGEELNISCQPLSTNTITPAPPNQQQQYMQQQYGLNLPTTTLDQGQLLLSPVFHLPATDLSTVQDLPINIENEVDPLDFIKALEIDIMGKNWHELWWDVRTPPGDDIIPNSKI